MKTNKNKVQENKLQVDSSLFQDLSEKQSEQISGGRRWYRFPV